MHKKFLTLVLLIIFCALATAQEQLNWDDFADVSFKPVYSAIYDTNFLKPTFGDAIESYRGKEVSIQGYFLDITGSGDIYLLSRNPMASCFFCGGAGPETIIEISFEKSPPFHTDQVIRVTGILELNADDVDHCNYILTKAKGYLVN